MSHSIDWSVNQSIAFGSIPLYPYATHPPKASDCFSTLLRHQQSAIWTPFLNTKEQGSQLRKWNVGNFSEDHSDHWIIMQLVLTARLELTWVFPSSQRLLPRFSSSYWSEISKFELSQLFGSSYYCLFDCRFAYLSVFSCVSWSYLFDRPRSCRGRTGTAFHLFWGQFNGQDVS